ncbi:hypothetical protein CAPTEDRAFT_34879, partial [Capitella teleta]
DSHLKAFMASLHKLQEKEVMTDVTLILPDQSAIPCHKVVLMAASPFFETMFQSGLKEGAEQNIKLDFTDSAIIKILVEFFYTGYIELTKGNIKAVVAGSEFLCCKHLKAHCEEYLVDTVGLSNCIDYYRYGQVFNLKLLIKAAFDFILSKFKEFKGIADFDKLTEDELVEVVSSDQLNAENEDVVFEAVDYWVNADPDAREEVFPRIAPLIRFPFCSQTALTDNICCNTLMQKPGCIDFAHEALWSQFHFNCRPPIHNARCIPRQAFHSRASTSSLFQLIKMKSPNKDSLFTTVTQEFDPASNEWRMRSQMPGYCYYGAAVALGDKIYVVGGSEKVCYSYDPENDEWKVLSKPTHKYYNKAATVWRGRILIGNREHVEEYDPVADLWS